MSNLYSFMSKSLIQNTNQNKKTGIKPVFLYSKGEIRTLDLTGMSRALSPAELPCLISSNVLAHYNSLTKIFFFKYIYRFSIFLPLFLLCASQIVSLQDPKSLLLLSQMPYPQIVEPFVYG